MINKHYSQNRPARLLTQGKSGEMVFQIFKPIRDTSLESSSSGRQINTFSNEYLTCINDVLDSTLSLETRLNNSNDEGNIDSRYFEIMSKAICRVQDILISIK